jgi:hypothetical protein
VFCSATDTIEQQCEPQIDAIVKSVNELNAVDVVIEGGEPLLYIDKTIELVKKLKERDRKVCIYTALPKNCYKDIDHLWALMDSLDHINVSILHTDHNVAHRLRGHSDDEPVESKMTVLAQLADRFPKKTRASFNLVRGYLDTYDDFRDNLKSLSLIGLRFVRVSELLFRPDLYVSIDDILHGHPGARELKSPFAFGCKTTHDASVFDKSIVRGTTEVTIRRACFLVEESRQATIWDIAKMFVMGKKTRHQSKLGLYNFKVVLENGEIKSNWNPDFIE